ncbi:MAG: hypothetical protein ACE5FT_06885, partial [Candidatus Nanoarchaeia archaeon]
MVDYKSYLGNIDYRRLTNALKAKFKHELARRGKDGYVVMLSPGPGIDDEGGPGVTSAITAKLLIDAVGESAVWPLILTCDNFQRPEWIDAAKEQVGEFGDVFVAKKDINGLVRANTAHYAENDAFNDNGTALSESADAAGRAYAEELRKLYGLNLIVASGYNIMPRYFFNVGAAASGNVAPMALYTRPICIGIGKALGMDEEFLKTRPSNGGCEGWEGTRIYNRIFEPAEQALKRPKEGYKPEHSFLAAEILENIFYVQRTKRISPHEVSADEVLAVLRGDSTRYEDPLMQEVVKNAVNAYTSLALQTIV